MTRARRVDPLETYPGVLQAFAAELTRIAASGDWTQIVAEAEASTWFAALPRCGCCGMPEVKYRANHPANPLDFALWTIDALRGANEKKAEQAAAAQPERDQEILAAFTGSNYRDLVKRFDMTERAIRNALARALNGESDG